MSGSFTMDKAENCTVGQAAEVNIYDSKFINNPNEIEMEAIINSKWWFFAGGVFILVVYFLMCVGTANLIGSYLNTDLSSGTAALIILYTLSAALTYGTLDIIENTLFKTRLFHIKYKNKAITYNGRERKFYDEIWDIKMHWLSSKKIALYGIRNDPKPKPYVINMSFRNEAEAKYLYDIFHAGKRFK